MLTGPELLAKVRELGDGSKSKLLRECGYEPLAGIPEAEHQVLFA